MVFLFIGTIFSTLASANGCINDASRAWFSMAPRPVSAAVVRGRASEVPHAVPRRSCSWFRWRCIFAYYAPLDQVITFSILSGLLGYTFMSFNVIMFRREVAAGLDPTAVMCIRSIRCRRSCCSCSVQRDLLRGVPRLRHAAVAMMVFFIIASLWFHFHRYRYVRRGDQFSMAWPRPQGDY